METGNVKEMLDALNEIKDTINEWRTNGEMDHWQYSKLFDITDAALAKPPSRRGTAMSERLRSRQGGTKSYVIATHVEVYVAEVVAPCMIMIAVHSHGRRCRMRLAGKKNCRSRTAQ